MTASHVHPTGPWLDGEAPAVSLTFGDWTMEWHGDSLSNIRFGGRRMLRSIRVVVRDRDWRTIPGTILSAERHDDNDRLELRLSARNYEPGRDPGNDDDLDFRWTGILHVDPDRLRFDLDGAAASAFESNRIGIIVLHYPDDAGTALSVEHPDGTTTEAEFPTAIAPHQPALDIAALRWARDGHELALRFDGDIFEMEDQRNWTDASFKTYSTPLSRPFPAHLDVGDAVRQSVEVRCSASSSASADVRNSDDPEPISVHHGTIPFPEIAVGASTAPASTGGAPGVIVPVTLVELDTRDANWRAALERAKADAANAALDVRIVAAAPEPLNAVLDTLAPLRLARIGVFAPDDPHLTAESLWDALVEGARKRELSAALIGGTRAHFTELNRNWSRLPSSLSALCFSVTAQMHDTDRAQVIESIAMQRLVARQAVTIADGKPVHVGPVTLRARFNAVATSDREADENATLESGYGAEHVSGATDPRQRGLAMAAWLIASASALATDGIASITYGEAWGPRGLGPANGAEPYPAGIAVRWLAELSGRPLSLVSGTIPEGCHVLAAGSAAEGITLLANLSDTDAAFRFESGAPVTQLLERVLADGSVTSERVACTGVRSEVVVVVPPGGSARLRSER